jgi:branched-chain amino acid transport system substrate-binding protein
MKKYLKIIFLIVIIVLVVLIVVNKRGSNTPTDKVTFGWFGPLSGPVASLGEQNLRGVQLAIKDYGHGRVNLKTEDDQFTVKSSISAYEKLKAEDVFMMLSPTYNGIMALAPTADKDKMLVANSIDSSSEIAKAGEYVLGIGYYADGHGTNFARKIEASNAKKVAIIYNQGETFTKLIVDSFKQQYKGEIVMVEGYKPNDTDFRTVISKLKSSNVDTVFLIGWDESGFFIKQSGELNYTPTVFGLASFTSPGFLGNAGKTKIPMYYLGWDQESKEYKDIVLKYKTEYKDEPSQPLFVALGYDAMTLVLKTLDKNTNPEEFRKNLYKTSVNGLTGTLNLDDDGIVRGITAQSRLFKVQ